MKKSDPFLKQYIDTKRCSIKNIKSSFLQLFQLPSNSKIKIHWTDAAYGDYVFASDISYSIIIMKINMVEHI